MNKTTPDSPDTKSADLIAANIEQLKAIFPEAFTEGKIDFDTLKQLLGGVVDEKEEKYGLNWHGKRRARQLALTPSTGTLLPCPDESVDWDTTKNLMIEGDNLEVLKLLQKSYAGKVKLIYIDPPYNTGNDFVYPDNFQDNIKNYLEITSQVDNEGKQLSSNTEASGRFHTDWLNMIYPRIKLARNLLKDDGLIFISIDEIESINLRKMCDDIFGPENFVGVFSWKNKYGAGAKTKGIIEVHEYIICYSKSALVDISAELTKEQIEEYDKKKDAKYPQRGGYITQPLMTKSMDDRENLKYQIEYNGEIIQPRKQWVWEKSRLLQAIDNDEVVFKKKKDGEYSVRAKVYLCDENGVRRKGKPISLLNGPFNQEGTEEVDALLGDGVFSFPKPKRLIEYLLSFVINFEEDKNPICVDFFAGSGTTAHAVMELNAKDQKSRRFILVQLPEKLELRDNQKKAATLCDRLGRPRCIAELTKERLRRAGQKIREENPMFAGDTGFRVFKLASSNIRTWEPNRDDLSQTLLDNANHLVPGRKDQDVLFELLLKIGLDLTVPIEQKVIAGKTVYSVGGGALMACMADAIDMAVAEPLAQGILEWRKVISPAVKTEFVFKDSGFADDVAKTNMAAIIEQNLTPEQLARIRSI